MGSGAQVFIGIVITLCVNSHWLASISRLYLQNAELLIPSSRVMSEFPESSKLFCFYCFGEVNRPVITYFWVAGLFVS